MLQWIEEVLAGVRAKPAKTARERRRGEGNWREWNSPAWANGRTNWRLT